MTDTDGNPVTVFITVESIEPTDRGTAAVVKVKPLGMENGKEYKLSLLPRIPNVVGVDVETGILSFYKFFSDVSYTFVTEKAKDVKVKINDGGTDFSVNVGEKLALNPTVTNAEEGTYHIHWTKTDGKKYFKFVKNNGEELTDDTVSANSINVLGVQKTADGPNADPADILVQVIEGKDHKNCTGTVLAEKNITLTVTEDETADPYAYGSQGKDLNKQSVLMVKPSDITQLYPAKDGDVPTEYINEFQSKFDASEEITFTFKMGKGMGGGYNEADFIENAVKQIKIYTKDGNTVAASYEDGTIAFHGMDNNVDRNITISVPAGTLDADTEYVLVFDETVKTKAGADELGVDVKFQFTTEATDPEGPYDDPTEEPTVPVDPEGPVTSDDESDSDTDGADDEAADVDSNGDADKDNKDSSAQTGDESNMVSMFAMMIAALMTAGVVFVRRREN